MAPADDKRFYLHDERESGLVLHISMGRKTFQLYKKHMGKPMVTRIGLPMCFL